VESQNYLGIYISKKTATIVCLGPQKKDGSALKCFSVSVEGQEQQDMQALVGLIAQGCAERNLKFSEVTVALDCSMFMQHSVHSEFIESKQIAATVRFDTEEALATDITNVAVAFVIASSDQTGSQLTVFTAERKILSEVLDALQQYNLDPVNIEPDVNCLSRFICQQVASAESEQTETLYGMLSHRSGYLIVPPVTANVESRKASIVRTFLVGATQDRTKLLQREVLVTTALAEGTSPIGCLKVFDSAGLVNSMHLSDKLGIEASEVDLRSIAETKLGPEAEADCDDPIDFAIAYGAAMVLSEKGRSVDFREDFFPFQGKKLRQRKTLKTAAISVTILLIAVGLYFQTQLFSVNRNKNNLRSKFVRDYAEVTLDRLPENFKVKDAVREVAKLLRRIEDEKKGLITDEKSISSNLTMVLTAFNKCAAQTNLNIDTITITSKDIMITGDTSNRQNRQRFFEMVRNSGLEITQESYGLKDNRENFRITIAPKA
jgi:type II secretory pathway component PulL